jgi:hypothetical protein
MASGSAKGVIAGLAIISAVSTGWSNLTIRLVGVVIATLFHSSALQVLRQAMQALRTPLATVQRAVELMTRERPHTKPSQTRLGQPHMRGTAGWQTPRRTSGCER